MSTSALLGLLILSQAPRAPSVDEVRTTARVLLQSMCGDQCDVIDVKVKTKRAAPVGAVQPGFDEQPAERQVPAEIALVVLYDAKLAPQYRKFVTDRLKHRVGELGLPVLVTEQVQTFPPPPELPAPIEPVREQPAPQPAPQPIIVQPPAQPAPAPPPPVDLYESLILKLIEALPILLALTLLGWLVLRVLRRMEEMQTAPKAEPEKAEEDPAAPLTLTPEVIEESTRAPEPSSRPLPPPSVSQLSSELRANRNGTRRVFRRWLMRGDHESVARAVALLGDFVVEDLSQEPALKGPLAQAGDRTAEILRAPITDEEVEELLRAVQAELVADKVAHRADDVRREFEPLLGWGPEAFAALMGRVDARQRLLLLRHAPGHLTGSFLAGLGVEDRADTVRRLLAEPPAEPEEIEEMAEVVQEQQTAALVGGYEADHIIDLLDSLPAAEQEAVVAELERKRPDFVRRNLGQLPVESALLRVPEHALAQAWAQVPFEDWITYLRTAPEAIRLRAVEASPARIKEGLQDELSLRVGTDPARAAQARRRIVRAALNAAPLLLSSGERPTSAVSALSVVQRREESKR